MVSATCQPFPPFSFQLLQNLPNFPTKSPRPHKKTPKNTSTAAFSQLPIEKKHHLSWTSSRMARKLKLYQLFETKSPAALAGVKQMSSGGGESLGGLRKTARPWWVLNGYTVCLFMELFSGFSKGFSFLWFQLGFAMNWVSFFEVLLQSLAGFNPL